MIFVLCGNEVPMRVFVSNGEVVAWKWEDGAVYRPA
jgi:hypothetical protein